MFLTIKLYLHLNCVIMLNWIHNIIPLLKKGNVDLDPDEGLIFSYLKTEIFHFVQ